MKNKIILLTFGVIIWLFAGTANAGHHCANLPAMKLTIDVYHLDLNDKTPICVMVPGEFKIKIHNPAGFVNEGDVTVRQKDDSEDPPVLIYGTNVAPANKITVKVEGNADYGDEIDFWIKVEGVGILDPRIRIVDPSEMNALLYNAVDETMDTYGLGIDDVRELKPPPQE